MPPDVPEGAPSSRAGIHYWKCDRPAALFGTLRGEAERAGDTLLRDLASALPPDLAQARLEPAGSQGNHLTFRLVAPGKRRFVRVEDGPERDDYLEVESALLRTLRAAGVPVPAVHASDATRTRVPFAWHVLDHVDVPDLNTHLKSGILDGAQVFADIGRWIARWQSRVAVRRCGPFDLASLRAGRGFIGLHAGAKDFFLLNLDRHLDYLAARGFLAAAEAARWRALLGEHCACLDDVAPVLVHKDMALWNVMGTPDRVVAFIDWDDAIGGDPLEDLALLACFHPAALVRRALDGYAAERALLPGWQQRFWLHLARNLIVKAVIRVGAGYFERSGGVFLLGAGGGPALRAFTRARLAAAAEGLRSGRVEIDYD